MIFIYKLDIYYYACYYQPLSYDIIKLVLYFNTTMIGKFA